VLWESWMLTRWGFLSRLVVALAFILLIFTWYETREVIKETDLGGLRGGCFDISFLCALSGLGLGRSTDGRGGFPFYLGFSRPIPTWLQVAIPMTYRTVCCTGLYLIPVLVTHLVYEMPGLTISASLLMIPITLMTIASSWWTDKAGISRLVGWVTVFFVASLIIYHTLHFNEHTLSEGPEFKWIWSFSFSPQDYLVLLLVSASAVVLSLAGVERQRHGDKSLGFWPTKDSNHQTEANWLVDLYQTDCPTTSAKRAELWSEINGRGLPVFMWCLITALAIPMLWFLTNLSGYEALWWIVTSIAVCIPIAAAPTLGIVTKQGIAYMSTFDATRPLNTVWLAGMKLGVSIVGIIAGMLVIGISFWFSAPLVDGFIVLVDTAKQFTLDYLETEPAVLLASFVFVKLVQLSTIVAFMAIVHTTYALYSDHLTFGAVGLILYACVLPLLIAMKVVPVAFAVNHVWFATGLMAAGALYFIYSLAKNRIMRPAHLVVFVFIWILYALAYAYLLRDDGLLDPETPTEFIVFRAGICVSSLTIFALAPWSLAKTRHQ